MRARVRRLLPAILVLVALVANLFAPAPAAAAPIPIAGDGAAAAAADGTFEIRGTVTGQGGGPLAGVSVYTGGDGSYSGTTSSDGTYTITVAPGHYTVSYSDWTYVYVAGYYGASGFTLAWNDALSLDATSGDVTGVDVELPVAHHITGTITGPGGTPLSGISVSAYSASYSRVSVTYSDGTFDLAVPNGDFSVNAIDWNSVYANGYYSAGGFVRTQAEASSVSVEDADVGGIDIELPLAVHIRGTVTDTDGNPLANIWVYASSSSGGGSAVTAADGTYTITPVPGTYTVYFEESSTVHQAGYYSSTGFVAGMAQATPVDVSTVDATGIDVQLPLALHIKGRVTARDGSPLEWVRITARSGSDEFASYSGSDGSYSIVVPAGTYLVRFDGSSLSYPSGFYSTSGVTGNSAGATPVVVTATDATGIDGALSGYRVTGRVTGTGGIPIASAYVEAISSGFSADAYTAADGTYSLDLAPGAYTFLFEDPAGNHATGWYNRDTGFTQRWQEATSVDVSGDVVVNLELPTYYTISGRVTGTGGVPLAGINVIARSATNDIDAVTGADGTYAVRVIPTAYKMWFLDPSHGHVDGWYSTSGYAGDMSLATDLTISTADIPGIDVELPVPVAISGIVRGGGSGVGGISVRVESATFLTTTYTATDGTFTALVPSGVYTIVVTDPNGIYLAGYYNVDGLAGWLEDASPIDATGGDVTGLTIDLPLATSTTPSVPIGVTAVRGNASATVSWTAPASDGGAPIIAYQISSVPDYRTCTTRTTSCTVTGLTNGTSYVFYVTPRNAVGWGETSAASAAVTPATVPDAPTNVTGTRGNGQVSVSWSAPPSNGGSAITSYTVTSSPDGKTCTRTGTFPRTCTVSGLTNGTAYTFTVTATNAIGTGAASAPSAAVTPSTVPGAPTGATATRGNASATVSWTAPASNGGAPITGYTVTSSPGGRTCTTTGALSCTVYSLTNGTSYTFTVIASNVAGTGAASSPSNAVTPATVPGAPTGVTGTRGNGQITVSWAAPGSGGSPITGYTVTAAPGGAVCTTTGAVSCTVTGLTNGTAYTFTVTATNALGTGAASTASAPVTPATVPDAPTGVAGARGNGSVTVSWTAPAWNGGAAITLYTVTASPGGRTCTKAAAPLSCTVTGLTNGTAYTFTVSATNAAGTSLPSDPSAAVTPSTVPGAPTGVAGVRGDTEVTVSWTAPASSGGAPITAYTVTASPGGRTCATTGALSCTVTGLTNGTAYTFTVTATNVAGTGAASSASAPVTPATVPDAPSGVAAVRGNGAATVSWTAPASNGGAPVTLYTVTASPGGRTCTKVSAPLSCTVTGLTNGTAYTFTVSATNAVGTSGPSGPSDPLTPATVPDPPTAVLATPGNGQVAVSWAAPTSDGGLPISGYLVTASPGGKTCGTTGALSCTVRGLTNGKSYLFTVIATNALGAGQAAVTSSSVVPFAPAAAFRVTGSVARFAGAAGSITVTAVDEKGTTASTYRGRVHLRSSDALSVLPADYTFTAADAGTHTFSITFNTAGTQSVLVADTAGAPSGQLAGIVVSYPASTYHPVSPARLLDTRPTGGGLTNIGLTGPFVAGTVRSFHVSGVKGIGTSAAVVPANAVAVTGNLTATRPTATGSVSLGPTTTSSATATALEFVKGDTRAASVTVALGPGGALSAVYHAPSGATVDLVFDVTGYFTPDATGVLYHPLAPGRVLDSRPTYGGVTNVGLAGAFRTGVVRTFGVSGVRAIGWSAANVPSTATAITGNLTVTNATSNGYVTLGPAVSSLPKTSTLNTVRGENRANGVVVALSGGRLQAVWVGTAGSTADVVFDVTGYFTSGSAGLAYHPVDPVRLLSTASGLGLRGTFASHSPRTLDLAGLGPLPSGIAGISGAVTLVSPSSAGWAYVGPAPVDARPASSTVNTVAGRTVANGFNVATSSKGSIGIVWAGTDGSKAHICIDVTGYWK